MWEPVAWMRPLTVFYYYQPQQVILVRRLVRHAGRVERRRAAGPRARCRWSSTASALVGYGVALWTLVRRDLPAPL